VWNYCKVGGVNVTVGLDCESGEELQLDWLELSETPSEEGSVKAFAYESPRQIRRRSWSEPSRGCR
jgi:hypothetical protein